MHPNQSFDYFGVNENTLEIDILSWNQLKLKQKSIGHKVKQWRFFEAIGRSYIKVI